MKQEILDSSWKYTMSYYSSSQSTTTDPVLQQCQVQPFTIISSTAQESNYGTDADSSTDIFWGAILNTTPLFLALLKTANPHQKAD